LIDILNLEWNGAVTNDYFLLLENMHND
jgi:hypothetical protein